MYLSPYITESTEALRNIISDCSYSRQSDRGRLLVTLLNSGRSNPAVVSPPDGADWLVEERWLFAAVEDVWRASRLRYASIETVSACNQSCLFCPVSHAPRAVTHMNFDLFTKILGELGRITTMQGIFLNHYNEPFLDKRLPRMAREIRGAGLKLAINTNASVPFEPENWRSESPLIHILTANLHTLDRERYAAERGRDDVAEAVRNVLKYEEHHVADVVRIVVLGDGGDLHRRDVAEIEERFCGTEVAIMSHLLMNRCGEVSGVPPSPDPGEILAGCEQTGSRVLEHLHVLTDGRCVLCCEDYRERHVVGDLRTESVEEVMRGNALSRHRRRIYGFERCDPNYICRACTYALPGNELRHY